MHFLFWNLRCSADFTESIKFSACPKFSAWNTQFWYLLNHIFHQFMTITQVLHQFSSSHSNKNENTLLELWMYSSPRSGWRRWKEMRRCSRRSAIFFASTRRVTFLDVISNGNSKSLLSQSVKIRAKSKMIQKLIMKEREFYNKTIHFYHITNSVMSGRWRPSHPLKNASLRFPAPTVPSRATKPFTASSPASSHKCIRPMEFLRKFSW